MLEGITTKDVLRKTKKALKMVARRPKGLKDYSLTWISALTQSPTVLGMPTHISIEPTSFCNAKCPVCETGAGTLIRKQGNMSYENFKIIIDKMHHHLNRILFYFMGEPFLNKDAYKMIKYAKSKNIFVDTCTNGDLVKPKELVACGIDDVSFQIGGTDQKTHAIYRINSYLEKTINNIREVVKEKERLGRKTPKIVLGFIVMKHNEHQVDDFFKLAKELKVDEARIHDPCVRNTEQGDKFLTKDPKYWFYDRDAYYDQGLLTPKLLPNNRCNWIYQSLVITHNGDVVPCCRDATGRFVMGNIFKQDVKEIWNGKKYQDFRNKIKTDQGSISICKLCSSYESPGLY